MLADGYHAIPRGKVATVVTHLEMRRQADTRAIPAPEGWSLTRIEAPTLETYRTLFRAVGEDWLWFGRMIMDDDALAAIIHDPKVHIYTLRQGQVDGALLELDFRTPGQCELVYFGLTKPLIGTGAGRYLMNCAIEKAWAAAITRFHVFTCTLDSPQALAFYRRTGFEVIEQKFEVADDPRLVHGYARSLAPHVPIIDP